MLPLSLRHWKGPVRDILRELSIEKKLRAKQGGTFAVALEN